MAPTEARKPSAISGTSISVCPFNWPTAIELHANQVQEYACVSHPRHVREVSVESFATGIALYTWAVEEVVPLEATLRRPDTSQFLGRDWRDQIYRVAGEEV
jgi:hypothetical protein